MTGLAALRSAMTARGLAGAGGMVASANRTELVALMRNSAQGSLPEGCSLAPAGALSAILATPAQPDPGAAAPNSWSGRRRALRAGVARAALLRQQQLEQLAGAGPVLPVAPGTCAPDDLGAFADANAGIIDRGFARIDACVQYQVTIGWDARRAASRSGAEGWQGDADLSRLAEDLAGRAHDLLAQTSEDTIRLPVDESVFLNMVLLIRPERLASLDAALERIDAAEPEGLRIRLLGPGPAVSFALLRLERVSPACLRKAASLLDLDLNTESWLPDDIPARRRAALLVAGSAATRGRAAVGPDEISRAATLLTVARRWERFQGRPATTAAEVVCASLHRDGDGAGEGAE